jgi:hypothetical protein
VSHAVGDVESKNGHPVNDDGGPFMHACYCGKWGFFGYDVMLMKGRTGTWFCAEHRPADEAPQLSTDGTRFRPS